MTDPNLPDGTPPPDPGQPGSAPPPPPPPPPGAGFSQQPGQPYQAAPPGYGAPPPAANPFGGVGKRLLSRIIDGLLIGIPLSIILGIFGARSGGVVSNAVIGIVSFAYFVFMETSKGGTFGKTWLGMSVADEAGSSPITTDASVRRNWWMLLSVLGGVPIIGLITALASLVIVIVIAVTISSDARNQGFHDKMGKTLVLNRPPAPAAAQP